MHFLLLSLSDSVEGLAIFFFFFFLQQEARMLRFIHHSNICPIISSFCPPNCQEAWLVLPSFLCSAQSLIADQYAIGVPEGAIAIIVRDVLLALQYLHSKCIIHRLVSANKLLHMHDSVCEFEVYVSCTDYQVSANKLITISAFTCYHAGINVVFPC